MDYWCIIFLKLGTTGHSKCIQTFRSWNEMSKGQVGSKLFVIPSEILQQQVYEKSAVIDCTYRQRISFLGGVIRSTCISWNWHQCQSCIKWKLSRTFHFAVLQSVPVTGKLENFSPEKNVGCKCDLIWELSLEAYSRNLLSMFECFDVWCFFLNQKPIKNSNGWDIPFEKWSWSNH